MRKIAHSSIDENGHTTGGVAGDQTGKEVCIRDWYNKPWNVVIRFKNEWSRYALAVAMVEAAKNDYIGYNQNKRNTVITEAEKHNLIIGLIDGKCDSDCSSLVSLGCMYAGVPKELMVVGGNACTTRTLRRQLEKSGLVEIFTDKEHTASAEKLITGDILLSEGHHVAVAV